MIYEAVANAPGNEGIRGKFPVEFVLVMNVTCDM